MADPIGTSLGVASLVIQLVDGVFKGYRFYIAAGNMPEKCLYLRTRLEMEHQRLLDWAQVVGLLEQEFDQPLPDILMANKYVLVAILTQIKAAMEEFAELNGRYKHLQDTDTQEEKESRFHIDIVEGFSSVLARDNQIATKRRRWLSKNNLLNMAKKGKEIASDPRRLEWVMFDEDVFQGLLQKLAGFNDYLYELLQGHQAKVLADTTRKTYLEMVSMRSSIEQLSALVTAAVLQTTTAPNHPLDDSARVQEASVLRLLADFKLANLKNDYMAAGEMPPGYAEATRHTNLDRTSITYEEETLPASASPWTTRTRGSLTRSGVQTQIWIEWKPYKTEPDPERDPQGGELIPAPSNLARAAELVALLQMTKPKQFCVPHSVGFFDNGAGRRRGGRPRSFGIVYDMSQGAAANVAPISLLQALIDVEIPALDKRVKLAMKLADCILYLHAVRWLHKAICSDNIIFFAKEKDFDLSEPLLCGFDYARPDRDEATYTGGVDPSTRQDFYQHPSYQGADARGTYRKTFDIYSLGIVLIELAYWQPIYKIMGFSRFDAASEDDIKAIRDRLLQEAAPFWKQLRASVGDKYAAAVRACIVGRAGLDVGENENEMDVVVGAKLQRALIRLVIDPLNQILR